MVVYTRLDTKKEKVNTEKDSSFRECNQSYRTDKNPKLERLKNKAIAGYADAQTDLGYYYETELGDFEKAVFWYKKAAEQDEQYALNNLGICYKRGLGVSQNKEMAFRYFYKASALGLSLAQCNLAQCYEYGDGVSLDYVEAGIWYLKAVEQGYNYASDHLEELANKIKKGPSLGVILLNLIGFLFFSIVISILFYFILYWVLCDRLKMVESKIFIDNYILNHSLWIFAGIGLLGWTWISFVVPHYRARKWEKRVFHE